jgi:hypothetical protein
MAVRFSHAWKFWTRLLLKNQPDKRFGRQAASRWLDENFSRIGIESTVDVRGRYL